MRARRPSSSRFRRTRSSRSAARWKCRAPGERTAVPRARARADDRCVVRTIAAGRGIHPRSDADTTRGWTGTRVAVVADPHDRSAEDPEAARRDGDSAPSPWLDGLRRGEPSPPPGEEGALPQPTRLRVPGRARTVRLLRAATRGMADPRHPPLGWEPASRRALGAVP